MKLNHLHLLVIAIGMMVLNSAPAQVYVPPAPGTATTLATAPGTTGTSTSPLLAEIDPIPLLFTPIIPTLLQRITAMVVAEYAVTTEVAMLAGPEAVAVLMDLEAAEVVLAMIETAGGMGATVAEVNQLTAIATGLEAALDTAITAGIGSVGTLLEGATVGELVVSEVAVLETALEASAGAASVPSVLAIAPLIIPIIAAVIVVAVVATIIYIVNTNNSAESIIAANEQPIPGAPPGGPATPVNPSTEPFSSPILDLPPTDTSSLIAVIMNMLANENNIPGLNPLVDGEGYFTNLNLLADVNANITIGNLSNLSVNP